MTLLAIWQETLKKDAEIRERIKSGTVRLPTPSQGKEGDK